MIDLNSVLLEGVIQNVKAKRDRSGYWVEMRNRRDKGSNSDEVSHRFRVEVRENLRGCPRAAFTIGQRIRVVGTLRRESKRGPFILAEHVEFKSPIGVQA